MATTCRPDLAVAVTSLARHQANQSKAHWEAAKRVLQYLKQSINLGIRFKGGCVNKNNNSLELEAYADASWADVPRGDCSKTDNGRKSTQGYILLLNDSPISWKCNLQRKRALSTMEAELMAATQACREIKYVRQMLKECGHEQIKRTTLHEDNNAALLNMRQTMLTNRNKHIELEEYFCRDCYYDGTIEPVKVDTDLQLADMFTKPLAIEKLLSFVNRIMSKTN